MSIPRWYHRKDIQWSSNVEPDQTGTNFFKFAAPMAATGAGLFALGNLKNSAGVTGFTQAYIGSRALEHFIPLAGPTFRLPGFISPFAQHETVTAGSYAIKELLGDATLDSRYLQSITGLSSGELISKGAFQGPLKFEKTGRFAGNLVSHTGDVLGTNMYMAFRGDKFTSGFDRAFEAHLSVLDEDILDDLTRAKTGGSSAQKNIGQVLNARHASQAKLGATALGELTHNEFIPVSGALKIGGKRYNNSLTAAIQYGRTFGAFASQRLNEILKTATTEVPIIGKLFPKIGLAVKSGTFTRMQMRYAGKAAILGAGWLSLKSLDWGRRHDWSPLNVATGSMYGATAYGLSRIFFDANPKVAATVGVLGGLLSLTPMFKDGIIPAAGTAVTRLNIGRAYVSHALSPVPIVGSGYKKFFEDTFPGITSGTTAVFAGLATAMAAPSIISHFSTTNFINTLANGLPVKDQTPIYQSLLDWRSTMMRQGQQANPLKAGNIGDWLSASKESWSTVHHMSNTGSLARGEFPAVAAQNALNDGWANLVAKESTFLGRAWVQTKAAFLGADKGLLHTLEQTGASWIKSKRLPLSSPMIRFAVGALGLALGVGTFASTETPQELRDIYAGKTLEKVQKGRGWEGGSTPYGGSGSIYEKPNWYALMMSRAEEIAEWGEDEDSISPWGKFLQENFTYNKERLTYDTNPYPITSAAFQNVPFIGPALAKTVGRFIKPAKLMHLDSWARVGEDGSIELAHQPNPLETPVAPELGGLGTPAPRAGLGGAAVFGDTMYGFTEQAGLVGWAGTQGIPFLNMKNLTGASRLAEDPLRLQSSAEANDIGKKFWDMELGGLLFSSEAIRRFYPRKPSTMGDYNPIPNASMPSWLPEELKFGSPLSMPYGFARLPGAGYCVHPDVLVQTDAGYKKISDVFPGDMVLTSEGYSEVERQFSRPFDGELISISSYGGVSQPTLLTPEHLVKAIVVNGCKYHSDGTNPKRRPCKPLAFCKRMSCSEYGYMSISWVQAKDLKEGDLVLRPLLPCEWAGDLELDVIGSAASVGISHEGGSLFQTWRPLNGKIIRNKKISFAVPEDFWWAAGFWLAEGSLKKCGISFATHENEGNVRSRLRSSFPELKEYPIKMTRGVVVDVGNKVLRTVISKYFGSASGKRIPRDVSFTQFEQLLSGLIQGDGHCSKEARCLTIAFVYKELLSDLIYLLDKFQFHWSLSPRVKKGCYELRILSSSVDRLDLMDHKIITLSDSKTKADFIFDGHRACKISKIEKVFYDGLVFDLQVKEKHEYTTSFIIHNSSLHPELKGVDPEDYPLLTRYQILGDVANWSKNYSEVERQLQERIDAGFYGTEELQAIAEVDRKVKERRNTLQFDGYVANANADTNERGRNPLTSIWQKATHNLYSVFGPIEYLIPFGFRPVSKLMGQYASPVEHYERYKVYGTMQAFWDQPVRDWFRPFFSSAAHEWSMGLYGGIPEHLSRVREVDSYFDKLEYMKWNTLADQALSAGDDQRAQEYIRLRSNTLTGMNPYGNPEILRALMPASEKPYFDAFLKTQDQTERSRILAVVPEALRPSYQAQWDRLDAVTSGDHETLRALRFAEETWNPNSQDLGLPGDVPPPSWNGWNPGIDIEDVKLKWIQESGGDIHDHGLWESQATMLSRKPYINDDIISVLNPQSSLTTIGLRSKVANVLSSYGLNDHDIQITQRPGFTGHNDIMVNYEDSRNTEYDSFHSRFG